MMLRSMWLKVLILVCSVEIIGVHSLPYDAEDFESEQFLLDNHHITKRQEYEDYSEAVDTSESSGSEDQDASGAFEVSEVADSTEGSGTDSALEEVAEEMIEADAVQQEVAAAPTESFVCDPSLPFGCCSNGFPAHGPDGEGCCANSTFGCCPDHRTPAESADLHSCNCSASRFGCCPDQKRHILEEGTLKGCGCQDTPHGCCPDQYTPAEGPEFEGCPCQSHSFGCCPDGVSVATGPNLESCQSECMMSEPGCCPDQFTTVGANGCGCDGSAFGCCPDGESEATGENFEGCSEIPGAACHLPKDPGTCKANFTERWHFDMEYGGCTEFWFSGCSSDAIANRFEDEESCNRECVSPPGSGRCFLPKVHGPCEGNNIEKWYYDAEWKKCVTFSYGGCLGNNNRFESKADCQASCQPANDLSVCTQPMEAGACRGSFERFYFDDELGRCSNFTYTGCLGNGNRFSTMEACENTCKHISILTRAKQRCLLERPSGSACAEQNAVAGAYWYFDNLKKNCLPFYDCTMVNGTLDEELNRFATLDDCHSTCPNSFPPEIEIVEKVMSADERSTAVLKIKVEANPPPTVYWQFRGENIVEMERFTYAPDGSLSISEVTPDDSGTWTILADNGLGQVARGQIVLKVHPTQMPIQISIPNKCNDCEESKKMFDFATNVTLPCVVKGYPKPIVRWYKNNAPVPRNDRIMMKDDNTLVIFRARPIDGGLYTCRATNEHESVTESVEVAVKKGEVPRECIDKPRYANCELIVRGNFCNANRYYAEFCCKSCTLAGQLVQQPSG